MKYEVNRGFGETITDQFLGRLKSFYALHPVNPDILSEHIWRDLFNHNHRKLHDLLLSGDSDESLKAYLYNLYDYRVMIGLDGTKDEITETQNWKEYLAKTILEYLRVSEQSSGLSNVNNPYQDDKVYRHLSVENIERNIGAYIGIRPSFGMYGLEFEDRFIHYNTASSIPVFNSILRLIPDGGNVMELGSGVGHMGNLISQKESMSYHSVDIGITSVIHAIFAARNWSPEEVWMDGEPENDHAKVRICGPKIPEKAFHLVLNVDSLPEIPHEPAMEYVHGIEKKLSCGGFFLSMNHESTLRGQRSVKSMVDKTGLRPMYRCKSWNRLGYVEECWIK